MDAYRVDACAADAVPLTDGHRGGVIWLDAGELVVAGGTRPATLTDSDVLRSKARRNRQRLRGWFDFKPAVTRCARSRPPRQRGRGRARRPRCVARRRPSATRAGPTDDPEPGEPARRSDRRLEAAAAVYSFAVLSAEARGEVGA
jgi:hypothetical protein